MNAVVKNNTRKVLTAYVSNGSNTSPVQVNPGEKCVIGKYSPYYKNLYAFNRRRGFSFSIEEESDNVSEVTIAEETPEIPTPEVSEPKRRGRRRKEEVEVETPVEETKTDESSNTEVEESTNTNEEHKDTEEPVTEDPKEEVE